MLNPKKLYEFRKKVNGHNYFVLFKYGNDEGRNRWNCICACMDWLEVSINNIEKFKISNNDINKKSMEAFSLLSSVDIICESIIQLHRVLFNTKAEPFKSDKKIFGDKKYFKNDKEYFKHIRAVFGAHPVNLNGVDDIKWFASWPTDHVYLEYDLAVSLYPSDPNLKSEVFGFKFEDIIRFGKKYYDYLDVLINKIDILYEEFCNQYRNIYVKKTANTVEQIKILIEEVKIRLNNDYIRYALEELEAIYEAFETINDPPVIVKDYINDTKLLVDEIYMSLQSMTFKDLEYNYLINPNFPNEIHYELFKIFDSLKMHKFDSMYFYNYNKIKKFLKEIIDLDTVEEDNEILLYIYSGLYYYNKKTG